MRHMFLKHRYDIMCDNKQLTLKGNENEKNNNEGLDNLHLILLIHVYALAKILQGK